jgi:carbon-monoxide dehydrogenase small subunit
VIQKTRLEPGAKHRVSLTVNGRTHEGDVEARTTLVDFLRVQLGLTGTHVGCEHGVCGACTVLMDGQAVRSCIMLAVQADGASLTTVEGLGSNGDLHPIQQAFMDCHGLQCGFCTPGFLMSVYELLTAHPDPSEEEIMDALGGNICRCTGYQQIMESVRLAAERMRDA